MKYTGQFYGKTGELYSVTIGNASDAQSSTLEFAEEAITIEEDSSSDIFLPLRLTTGYVRIISDGSAWTGIVPSNATSMPVVVEDSQNKVILNGFLSTETFGADYGAGPHVVELPFICPLQALESFEMPTSPVDCGFSLPWLPTFSELIKYLLGLVNIGVNNYDIQADQNITLYLGYRVQYSLFVAMGDGGDSHSRYNCREVLEEICKFLGLSARMNGGNVLFTCADVATLESGSLPLAFANENQSEEFLRGARDISVTADVGDDEDIIELPLENILDKHGETGEISSKNINIDGSSDWYLYRLEIDGIPRPDETVHTVGMTTIKTNGDARISARTVGQFGAAPSGDDRERMNWNIDIFRGVGTELPPYSNTITLTTSEHYALSRGKIRLNGKVAYYFFDRDSWTYQQEPLNGTIMAVLIVGGYYWDGFVWVTASHEVTFPLYANQQGSFARYVDSTDPFEVPLPTVLPLVGPVTFKIMATDITNAAGVRVSDNFFSGIGIEYVRSKYRTEHSVSALLHNTTNIGGGYEVNTIFGNDGDKTGYGFGLVMTIEHTSGTITGGDYIRNIDTTARPQNVLASRIKDWNGKNRRVLRLELVDGAVNGWQKLNVGGVDFYPVSISRRLWDGIVSVVLVELGSG